MQTDTALYRARGDTKASENRCTSRRAHSAGILWPTGISQHIVNVTLYWNRSLEDSIILLYFIIFLSSVLNKELLSYQKLAQKMIASRIPLSNQIEFWFSNKHKNYPRSFSNYFISKQRLHWHMQRCNCLIQRYSKIANAILNLFEWAIDYLAEPRVTRYCIKHH